MIEWPAGKRFSCRRASQFVLVYFKAFPKFVGGFHATGSRHIARLALNAEPSRTAFADGRCSGHKRPCRPAHYERPAAQARNAAARRISENCASDNRPAPSRSATCPRIRSWKRRLHRHLASPLMNNCRPLVMADRGRLLRDLRAAIA
jgi:hypothetical protein